jgi:tetratricopeptide (TPR) repeat protein
MGDLESGSNQIEEILKIDSRNIDALQVGARIYAARNETELAIKLQLRISEIDPYNAENYYVLLKNYKLIGDFDNAKFMREKIKQVAPNSEQFRLAIDEISAQENN